MAVIKNITRPEYDALPGLNWSTLKAGIGRTAAHILAARDNREDKPAFKFGRAFHHAVLQPDLFPTWTVVPGKTTTKPDSITEKERDDIQAMAQNAYDLHDGQITHQECALTWTYAGHECKALIDGLLHRRLVDAKSTQNAEPGAFKGEIFKFKYHGQAAWYLSGLAANGIDVEGASLLAVEKSAPYSAGLYRLLPTWIELGRALYDEALTALAEGKHGYGEQDLDAPEWAQPGLTINDEGGVDL